MTAEQLSGNYRSPNERPFWPTSHWVKEPATAEDLRRVEEKVNVILATLIRLEQSLTFAATHPQSRLPRSE